MNIHELKTWSMYFAAVASGRKPFEVRHNDRGFEEDDVLILREYEPGDGTYTGRELARRVTYILTGNGPETFGLAPGCVVMGLGAPNMTVPKFRPAERVKVLERGAVVGPGVPAKWLPGTVVEISGRDEFANTWIYQVMTEGGMTGGWSESAIRDAG